jgi:hypothetical protein
MRKFWFIALALGTLCVLSGSVVIKSTNAESGGAGGYDLRGDYVETRTASVFAGACHYNGEVTTAGRDALMAWNVRSGIWNGVELGGVKVVAIVSAESNLADNSDHRSEIIIDREASHAQAAAILDALKTKYAVSLGRIVSVSSAPVKFQHDGKGYYVSTTNLASMTIEAMPNDLCCKMPNMVWYSPLATLENRKVGYTRKAIYSGGTVGEPWERSDENSAFYGNFSF